MKQRIRKAAQFQGLTMAKRVATSNTPLNKLVVLVPLICNDTYRFSTLIRKEHGN